MARHGRRYRQASAPLRHAGRVRALLALGMVLGLGTVSTLAAWTGTATATATVGAATIDVQAGSDPSGLSHNFTIPTAGNWYPGMSQAFLVDIKNTQTVAFAYSLKAGTADTTGPTGLGAVLTATSSIGAKGTMSATNGVTGGIPTGSCSGGTANASTPLTGSPIGTGGTLAGGGVLTLCVVLTLPVGAPSTLQGAGTAVTFTVGATLGS